jgi:acyl carrier protein
MHQMSAADFTATLAPKLAGGWALDRRLADQPLDFFVLFSSVGGLGFSLGQSDYAAANAFLDALAHHRRGRGLPAASIAWGAWGEVGMASPEKVARDFVQRGFQLISPELGVAAMERVFEHDPAHATAVLAEWPELDTKNYPAGAPVLLQPILAEAAAAGAAAPQAAETVDVRRRLAALDDPDERRAALTDHLRELVARVLRLDPSRLAADQPFNALGLDSIMAVELRNRIEGSLGTGPTVVELLQGASLASRAAALLPRLAVDESAGGDLEALADDLEALSDQEIHALLDG